jgi:putative nucleotidyltransferase with HDIG domain
MPISFTHRFGRRPVFLGLLLLLTTGLSFLAQAISFSSHLGNSPLRLGDVAPQEILAPYTLTFESKVLTEKEREAAAKLVASVYTPADPSVGRRQLEQLRATLAYISSIRADNYASTDQKMADLAMLEDLSLQHDTAINILNLSDARWQAVQQEANVELEQVMRNTIRVDQLEDTRRNIPALVNLSLTQEQAAIVVQLAAAFVAPNSIFDQNLTEAAYQKARQAVSPVTRSFVANEVVIQRGQVISEADLEALEAFNLIQSPTYWQDIASAVILPVLMMTFFVLYLNRNPALANDLRALTMVAILFLVFLLGARITIPGHAVLPYLYPLMAYSLTVAALFGAELALVTILPLSLLVSYGLPNALDLTLFYTLSSFFGVLTLRRARRLTLFFWAGAAIAISGATVIIAYRLPQQTTDWIGLLTLSGAACFNGVISAGISILLQFFLAQFLGRTTALQLIELSRPDHPLLQFLLRNAPGTYQHSLQVATLAEQAAERIGADPLLTRVGALYHDVGKATNPGFFIENQLAGDLNPHHNIEPTASATTIIRHVTEGLELARKHHLPSQIQAFIAEHHGTLATRYQYIRAVDAIGGDESKVDIKPFRYPGPRPQSRETALLMLADGCEARVRAERPKDEDELRTVLRVVIDDRVKNGELDNTDLTLRDLNIIIDSFTASLRGIYHPRIQYPSQERMMTTRGESSAPQPSSLAPASEASTASLVNPPPSPS